MRSNERLDVKIVVLGAPNCGKTTITHRYINSTFIEKPMSTVGAGLFTRELTIDGVDVNSTIWDTAGEERFRSVAPSIVRGADGCILVYDVSAPDSFREIELYFDMIRDVLDIETQPTLPILLMGNKVDLSQQAVSQKTVDDWMKRHRVTMHKSVSAKNGEGIEEAFGLLTSFLVSRTRQKVDLLPQYVVSEVDQKGKRQRCCY